MLHFDYFCEQTKTIMNYRGTRKYCPGSRFVKNSFSSQKVCFKYDPKLYDKNQKEYFIGYPIIKFFINNNQGNETLFNWYPSEYLYRYNLTSFCFGATMRPQNWIMIGMTMMRQHHFYFSPEQNIVSIARANCSDDSNMMLSENDYLQYDFDFGLNEKDPLKSQ